MMMMMIMIIFIDRMKKLFKKRHLPTIFRVKIIKLCFSSGNNKTIIFGMEINTYRLFFKDFRFWEILMDQNNEC